jgi:hypothetical protein
VQRFAGACRDVDAPPPWSASNSVNQVEA